MKLEPLPDELLPRLVTGTRAGSCLFRRLPDGRVESLFLAAGTYQRLDPVS